MITQLTNCLNVKTSASQTTTQMLNKELKDPSCVHSYNIPCELALKWN